jgi:hypothetical protein
MGVFGFEMFSNASICAKPVSVELSHIYVDSNENCVREGAHDDATGTNIATVRLF